MHPPSVQTNVTHNRNTADLYDTYAPHRESLMALVNKASPHARRIAFLGAGNCNDIDLTSLMKRFQRITLFDLDRDAIVSGLARQKVKPDTVRILAPYDLSAPLLERIEKLTRQPSSAKLIAEELVQASVSETGAPDSGVKYDVIVSCCLLSQMINSVLPISFSAPGDLAALVAAVRMAHLNRMSSWLVPGGTGILVSDFVSSDSAPELLDPEKLNLADYARDQINRGNFFTGVNPAVIQDSIHRHPTLEFVRPPTLWVWPLALRRYLVAGFEFRRTADAANRSDEFDRDGSNKSRPD